MLATVDWNALKWSLFAIAVIVMLMVPLFWWLYDSDRVGRYWPTISTLLWACLSFERTVRLAAQGDWWWATPLAFISIILLMLGIRDLKRERGRIHSDATPP